MCARIGRPVSLPARADGRSQCDRRIAGLLGCAGDPAVEESALADYLPSLVYEALIKWLWR
jgi:hypothetical protein